MSTSNGNASADSLLNIRKYLDKNDQVNLLAKLPDVSLFQFVPHEDVFGGAFKPLAHKLDIGHHGDGSPDSKVFAYFTPYDARAPSITFAVCTLNSKGEVKVSTKEGHDLSDFTLHHPFSVFRRGLNHDIEKLKSLVKIYFLWAGVAKWDHMAVKGAGKFLDLVGAALRKVADVIKHEETSGNKGIAHAQGLNIQTTVLKPSPLSNAPNDGSRPSHTPTLTSSAPRVVAHPQTPEPVGRPLVAYPLSSGMISQDHQQVPPPTPSVGGDTIAQAHSFCDEELYRMGAATASPSMFSPKRKPEEEEIDDDLVLEFLKHRTEQLATTSAIARSETVRDRLLRKRQRLNSDYQERFGSLPGHLQLSLAARAEERAAQQQESDN